MTLSDLPWVDAPLINGRQARFFGYSIIQSPFIVDAYEVMDKSGDTHRFASDEELLIYLKQKLPGCFLEEI